MQHRERFCIQCVCETQKGWLLPDDSQFREIGLIPKTAEQEFIRCIAKFHQRRIDRLEIKKSKVESEKSRKTISVSQNRNHRAPLTPKETNEMTSTNVLRLASDLQAKFNAFSQMMSSFTVVENKQSEKYYSVFSVSKRKKYSLTIRNHKRRTRKNLKHIETSKQHIKNLSNIQLRTDQINLLSRGLKFIPTPVMKEKLIRRQLLSDFNQFARRMRLQYIYHDKDSKPHPFYVKSNWSPPIQPSVALESYLEEVKIQLAETPLIKPKNNLPSGECQALKELIQNIEIVIKKADKSTTTVIMDKAEKIKEGQTQLDDRNNYQPLDKPMVRDTSMRIKNLITALEKSGCIDETTVKWFNQTPNPPRIPVFYTLTKTHKPTMVGRPIISGCDGPTERLSSFVDKLLQPIAQIQDSYLKDTTDFIKFIESTRVPRNAFLVSMDVTSLYTNIPHEEGITLVCETYEEFHDANPPIATRHLKEMLSLILQENSFQFNGKDSNGKESPDTRNGNGDKNGRSVWQYFYGKNIKKQS